MRIATDIGGTFTDLVALSDDGALRVVKASTTPPHFERGIADALERLRAQTSATALDAVEVFLHGTTVVINTITERAGARVGLITTRGFRDVLEIGRANRPDLYNFYYEKPAPLVPRYLRLEVDERRDYSGAELRALDEDGGARRRAALRDEGCEAVAIAFLHSYADPASERRAAALVAEEWPGMHVTVSADVTREWREYERTSTAVLNAYVQPRAAAYLAALDGTLRAAAGRGRRARSCSHAVERRRDHARRGGADADQPAGVGAGRRRLRRGRARPRAGHRRPHLPRRRRDHGEVLAGARRRGDDQHRLPRRTDAAHAPAIPCASRWSTSWRSGRAAARWPGATTPARRAWDRARRGRCRVRSATGAGTRSRP